MILDVMVFFRVFFGDFFFGFMIHYEKNRKPKKNSDFKVLRYGLFDHLDTP